MELNHHHPKPVCGVEILLGAARGAERGVTREA